MRMKNRFFQFLYVAAAVVVMLSSCSKIPDQMNAIPSDASMVLVFNTKQLLLKAKMDQFNQTNIFKKLKTVLEAENPEMGKFADELVKNPQLTGIKITSDVCFYASGNKDSQVSLGLLAGIKSKENFEKFVTGLLDLTKSNEKIEKDGDVSYISSYSSVLIWNDKSLLLLFSKAFNYDEKGILAAAKSQILQGKSNSLVANADFVSFYKKQKDVDMWLSNKNLQNMIGANPAFRNQLPFMGLDANSHIHAEFKKGEIVVNGESVMSDSLKKVLAEKPIARSFENKQLLQLLPDSTALVGSISVNMGNIYELFIKKIPELNQVDQMLSQSSLSVQEIFNTLGGDFVLAISTIGSRVETYPTMTSSIDPNTGEEVYRDTTMTKEFPSVNGTLCFSINNTKVIDSLMAKIPQGQLQKTDNYYVIPIPTMPVYLNIGKGAVVLTTNKDVVEKAETGGLQKNLAGTDMANKIMGNASYFYMNVNIKSYPKLQKILFDDMGSSPQKTAAFNMWSIFDYVEGSSNATDMSSKGVVKFTSDSENSLYLILKTIDDNFEKLL